MHFHLPRNCWIRYLRGVTVAVVSSLSIFAVISEWEGMLAGPPMDVALCAADPVALEPITLTQTAYSAWEAIKNECAPMTEQAIRACDIPNVAHFIWYSGIDFRFDHYLSIRSVYNALKPDHMYIHGRIFPKGNRHFDRCLRELGLKAVLSREISSVYDRPVENVVHKSDILRMELLIRFGGMYFDLDVLVFRPLPAEFWKLETIVPKEWENVLNSGIILSKRCSRFMLRWYRAYKTDFNDGCWGCAALYVPRMLAEQDSSDIRMDGKYIKSNFPEAGDMLFSNDTSPDFWDDAVGIHTFIRSHPEYQKLSETEVVSLNNNYGRIIRNIMSNKVGF